MMKNVCLLTLLILLFLACPAAPVPAQGDVYVIPGILTRDPVDRCDVLSYSGEWYYMLDDFGTFSLGDTVLVTASVEESCVCDNYTTYPCLHGNTIAEWRDFDFGCGRLARDPEYGCGFFNSAKYGRFAIGGLSGYAEGDSVRIIGNMQLEPCIPIPECWGLCLFDRTLSPCPDSIEVIRPASWGTVKAEFR